MPIHSDRPPNEKTPRDQLEEDLMLLEGLEAHPGYEVLSRRLQEEIERLEDLVLSGRLGPDDYKQATGRIRGMRDALELRKKLSVRL
jgi:hypothetical protein